MARAGGSGRDKSVVATALAGALLVALGGGCGADPGGEQRAPIGALGPVGSEQAVAATDVATTVPIPDFLQHVFDPADFSDPTTIDNPYYPLPPGRQFVLAGEANRGEGELRHRLVITVTDLTKVIDGVRTVVVWERDINQGTQVETELAFFAQDDDGNVWNLGEYPEEYEERTFVGAPSTWIAGGPGSVGGVHVSLHPEAGSPAYLEGKVDDIEFFDLAQVQKTDQHVCIPLSCYDGVVVVDEWDPLAQPHDGHQLKHYAPGVGLVTVTPLGGDEQETLELESTSQLSAVELADVRTAALKLDERAYQFASAVYGATAPAGQD